jgi:predicted TIM-barrel fold metal-dependent hydrolase
LAGLAASLSGCGGEVLKAEFPKALPCGPSCVQVDAHCHVFNGSDLPIAGFLSHVAPIPHAWSRQATQALHRAINAHAPSGADELVALQKLLADGTSVAAPQASPAHAEVTQAAGVVAAELEKRFGTDLTPAGNVAAVALQISRPRHEVAATLVSTYSSIDLFTPLLVDYAYFDGDSCNGPASGTACQETPLKDQLAVHSALSVLSMRGLLVRPEARLHPFAPFNPLREVRERMPAGSAYAPFGVPHTLGARYGCNGPALPALANGQGALGPLRHAIERLGFMGVKLYPPAGFLPLGNSVAQLRSDDQGRQLDLALSALYAYCDAEQVPITTHTANSNGYALGYGMLSEPKHWERVLVLFPSLRLNLGHFGHLMGLAKDDERGLLACESWMRQAAALMQRFPNVYVDVANSPVPWESGYAERFIPMLKAVFDTYPKSKSRMMYGSDFWLNQLDPNHESFVDAFDDHFGKAFPGEKRALMGLNALRFLGLVGTDDAPDVNNKNRQRLLAFYESQNGLKPRWFEPLV